MNQKKKYDYRQKLKVSACCLQDDAAIKRVLRKLVHEAVMGACCSELAISSTELADRIAKELIP